MYSHLNDPFSERGRGTHRLGAVCSKTILTLFLHMNRHCAVCMPFFYFWKILYSSLMCNFQLQTEESSYRIALNFGGISKLHD